MVTRFAHPQLLYLYYIRNCTHVRVHIYIGVACNDCAYLLGFGEFAQLPDGSPHLDLF
jgi:hypothetical protein